MFAHTLHNKQDIIDTDKKSVNKSDSPKPTAVPRYPNVDLASNVICKAVIFGLLCIISRHL